MKNMNMEKVFNEHNKANRTNDVITAVLIGLIVVILIIVAVMVFRVLSDKQVEKEAQTIVEEFDKVSKVKPNDNQNENISGLTGISVPIGNDSGTQKKQGKRVKFETYDVVGTIRIPKIGIKYPILYPTDARSLEKGVTLLDTVAGVNEPGNSTILGHNYRNSMFFSKLHTLKNGDKVYVKDLDGRELEYTIYEGNMKKPNDGDYIRRDTKGKTEISLSTCNTDSSLRYVVFARKTGE